MGSKVGRSAGALWVVAVSCVVAVVSCSSGHSLTTGGVAGEAMADASAGSAGSGGGGGSSADGGPDADASMLGIAGNDDSTAGAAGDGSTPGTWDTSVWDDAVWQ